MKEADIIIYDRLVNPDILKEAKQIRRHFEKIIPKNVGAFLTKMRSLRVTMPKGKERMQYFDTLVEEYFK